MSEPTIADPVLYEIVVPDLGDFHDMPVIELSVKTGDVLAAEQTILMVESDKATMDVPTPIAGRILHFKVAVGDKVNTGTLIALLEPLASQAQSAPAPQAKPATDPLKPAVHTAQIVLPVPGPINDAEPALPAGEHADLVVIGAGPGGYTAAFRAADLGRKVVLIDRWDTLGGVCLNVGCIPSKALLHAAKVITDNKAMTAHGLSFQQPEIDLAKLRAWKDSVVARLTGGLVDLAARRKVTVLHGTGCFVGPHTLRIDNQDGSRTLHFDQAIIAAGSEPVVLPFLPSDDPRIVDSTGALALENVPARLLVLGGGVIGLEMATVYSALGSKVTVIERMDQIIPGADRDLVAPLFKALSAQGVDILLSTTVTAVNLADEAPIADFVTPQGNGSAAFDRILVAVGRKANGCMLGVESAGVMLAPDGSIPVDRQMRTNVPHIFAIGDVAGQPMLAHKATHEAKVAAEVACGHNVLMQARVIPAVAYTDPEVAWVGLTESEAKAQGIAVEKAVFPWAASGRSLALGRDEGFTKLLFDRETQRLVGAGIVGTSAGDLIAEAGLAIEMGADHLDIGLTIHPHPTLSETIGAAAEVFSGTITDLLPVRRKATPSPSTPQRSTHV